MNSYLLQIRFGKLGDVALRCGGVILVAVGCLKLLSLFGDSPILSNKEPLLNVNYGRLFLMLGLLETSAGALVVITSIRAISAAILFLMGALFLAHKLFSLFLGIRLCPCLGSALDWLPWLSANQEELTLAVALWLLLVAIWWFHISHATASSNQHKPDEQLVV